MKLINILLLCIIFLVVSLTIPLCMIAIYNNYNILPQDILALVVLIIITTTNGAIAIEVSNKFFSWFNKHTK